MFKHRPLFVGVVGVVVGSQLQWRMVLVLVFVRGCGMLMLSLQVPLNSP